MPRTINIHSRKKVTQFLTYQQAREVVRNRNFTSKVQFSRWLKREKRHFANIPALPDKFYADEGFSWEDFLGDAYIEQITLNETRSNLSYTEVRDFARTLNITKSAEWARLAKQGKLPADIPTRPDVFFKRRGTWTGWEDFLDSDYHKRMRNLKHLDVVTDPTEINVPDRTTFVLPFNIFRENVRKQNFISKQQYYDWCKINKMYGKGYPLNPDKVYMFQALWTDWYDLLGIYNPNAPSFSVKCSYLEAKKFAQSLNLRTEHEWRDWCLDHPDNRPDVPRYPDKHYGEYWEGWQKFLGTNVTDRLSEDLYKISVLWVAKTTTKYNNVFAIDIETKGVAATYDDVFIHREYQLVAMFKYQDELLNHNTNMNTRDLVKTLIDRHTAGTVPGYDGIIIGNVMELISDLKMYFDPIPINMPEHIRVALRGGANDKYFTNHNTSKGGNEQIDDNSIMDML